jgi:uncharacterized membrane protein
MVLKKRFSIGFLMAIVFFVATDFAIVRAFWGADYHLISIALASLPMLNLLLLVLPKLRRTETSRMFWLGFEAIGWLMMILVVLVGWFEGNSFFSPIGWVAQFDLFPSRSIRQTVLLVTFTVLFYNTPQVLAAMIGGRLSARYRVIIERRPRSDDAQVGGDVDLANGRPIDL